MILINIKDFDLRYNVHEIVLEMIKLVESSYEKIIIFGDSFDQVTIDKSDDITFNNNTLSIVYKNGICFVVKHKDIAAFKVIR